MFTTSLFFSFYFILTNLLLFLSLLDPFYFCKYICTLAHDFFLVVVNHLSHPLPFYTSPSLSLSSCHWERVNTKPPLLTSTLKHWDAGRQGDSLTAASCQRHKVNFCLSVIVQNQTLPPSSASSPPARRYLRPSVWDTGNVLITTRVSVLMSLETKNVYFKVSLFVFASTCHLNASKWNLWSWWM